MPSPAAEAHQKEMQEKYAPAEAAMLKNATPQVLYTHHVMAIYRQYDLLGRVNAVSNNHRAAHPILEALIDHAMQAMAACVACEAEGTPTLEGVRASLSTPILLAVLLKSLDESIATADAEDAGNAVDAVDVFLGCALQAAQDRIQAVVDVAPSDEANQITQNLALLQDHYLFPGLYTKSSWIPIDQCTVPEGVKVDLWTTSPHGDHRAPDCWREAGEWKTWDLNGSCHVKPGLYVDSVVTHFRHIPRGPVSIPSTVANVGELAEEFQERTGSPE